MGSDQRKVLIGISACLVGEAVRYDGAHKRQPVLMATIAAHAHLRPFCPEVVAGLGVPRPPVQLVRASDRRAHARGVADDSLDVTEALAGAADDYCAQQLLALDGFVFKSRSPSCGLGSAPLHSAAGEPLGHRDGLFAARVKRAAPQLPCVEEGWLDSAARCRRFLAACCAHAYYRRDNRGYGHLTALLESELQVDASDGESKLVLLVEALLRPDADSNIGPDSQNAKTALERRLLQYFAGENGYA